MGSGFLSTVSGALSAIPIIGPIFDILSGISVQNQIGQLANSVVSLGQHIASILQAAGGFFSAIWKFLKHVWNNYIKAAIQWLADHVRKLRNWLKRTIDPIIKRLQKIKKWYDEHILKQQLRMLKMIQTIRFFLGILRLFHVKWAAKLDQSLADLQNRIEEAINVVRGTLNQIINTLAIAFDPTMLITSNVLAASLLGNLGAVKRIFGYGFHGPLTASETAFIAANVGRFQKSSANGHIATVASSGLTSYDKSEVADSRRAIEDASGAPPPLPGPISPPIQSAV
jgi:hypothetical protein